MVDISTALTRIINYIFSNWASITVTLIISSFSLYGSHRLLSRYQTSEYEKRLNEAKKSVLDILENYIITSREIEHQKLENLISAVDRRSSFDFSSEVTHVSLLQDLELRIEESRHLDTDQKHAYANNIDNIISNIKGKKKNERLSDDRTEIIRELTKKIENEDKQEALEEVEKLKKKLLLESQEKELENIQTTEIKLVQALIALLFTAAIMSILNVVGMSSLGGFGALFIDFEDMLKTATILIAVLSIIPVMMDEL